METERAPRLARLPGLFTPVDGASAVAFRVAFGALMVIAVARFFAHGWIAEYYLAPAHFFPYPGLDWIRPWPGIGMYVHFAAMGVLAVGIATGVAYRFSVIGFGALFAYAHLIDRTNYLNHYWLVICLCVVLACLPLGRGRTTQVPRWVVWALRGQLAVVYLFGGIAKLKADWLFDAQPMQIWLGANTDFPLLGRLFAEPATAYVFSWAGALFDLSIVPLLLWRRSRPVAYVAVVGFHLVTARLFQLGLFPWIMMASSLIFLPPDWPRRALAWVRPQVVRPPDTAIAAAAPPSRTRRRLVVAALATWFAFQIALPLRHWLYPGDVMWTEEGYRFAWNVMLMEKTGAVDAHVLEPATGRRWVVSPRELLTPYQAKMMASQPDMILQFAHLVAAAYRARGVRDPEVRVDAVASLNGRRRTRLIDPTVDLAHEAYSLAPARWILPLTGGATRDHRAQK